MPESDFTSPDIVKAPSWTFIRSSTQALAVRFQEIIGTESPVAEQLNNKDSPTIFDTLLGGLVANVGADQTTNVVTADAFPRGLTALHTYGPVSSFLELVRVTDPLLEAYVTLSSGMEPVNFFQLTAGAGNPDT